MLQASRLLRPAAALGIVAASLAMSVSIAADDNKSSSDADVSTNVGASAVANRSAARTGVTNATDEPAPPPTTPPAPPVSSVEQRVLELVNVERTSRGLHPLALEGRLNTAARAHSEHQAQVGTIFHVSPDGTTPGQRITAAGYAFSAWAENVAAGHSSPEAVVAAWMRSPGHCKNLLNPAYVHLGIGYVNTTSGYRHWWTQKFARPSTTPAPAGSYNPAWC